MPLWELKGTALTFPSVEAISIECLPFLSFPFLHFFFTLRNSNLTWTWPYSFCLDIACHSLNSSLLILCTRYTRFILYFSFPSPRLSHFFQEVLAPFSRKRDLETKIFVLDVLIAMRVSLLLGPFRGWRETRKKIQPVGSICLQYMPQWVFQVEKSMCRCVWVSSYFLVFHFSDSL